MKASTRERNTVKVLLVALTFIMVVTLIQVNANAGIFGMGEYPGGKLKAVFRISEPSSDAPERVYTIKIEPQGDSFKVTEKVSSPGREKGDGFHGIWGKRGSKCGRVTVQRRRFGQYGPESSLHDGRQEHRNKSKR